MRSIIIQCITLLVLSAVVFPDRLPAASEGEREAAQAAAENELQNLLQVVPDAELPLLGFNDRPETYRAGAGIPFMVYTINSDDVMSFGGGSAIGSVIRETGVWYVPVVVNNEYRALVTVVPVGDKLTAVGISAAALAQELEAFQDSQESSGIVPAISPKFVRIRQAASDFMYLETGEGEYLRPFSSAQIALGVAPDTLLEPARVMPAVKAAVQSNLMK